jgi:hypothetical protein
MNAPKPKVDCRPRGGRSTKPSEERSLGGVVKSRPPWARGDLRRAKGPRDADAAGAAG